MKNGSYDLGNRKKDADCAHLLVVPPYVPTRYRSPYHYEISVCSRSRNYKTFVLMSPCQTRVTYLFTVFHNVSLKEQCAHNDVNTLLHCHSA